MFSEHLVMFTETWGAHKEIRSYRLNLSTQQDKG